MASFSRFCSLETWSVNSCVIRRSAPLQQTVSFPPGFWDGSHTRRTRNARHQM